VCQMSNLKLRRLLVPIVSKSKSLGGTVKPSNNSEGRQLRGRPTGVSLATTEIGSSVLERERKFWIDRTPLAKRKEQ